MLECEDVLAVWSLVALPRSWATALGVEGAATDEVDATRLDDHRLAYLDYEGPVAGTRGTVRRCDGGHFRWLNDEGSLIEVKLGGAVMNECVRLSHDGGVQWTIAVVAV